MTVTADGVTGRKSGARASRPHPARAGAGELLSRADRAARGKQARAQAPLDSHAEFAPGKSRDPVGLLLSPADLGFIDLRCVTRLPMEQSSIRGASSVSSFPTNLSKKLPLPPNLLG